MVCGGRDLPSVKEMEQQMAAFRLLDFLLSKDQRKQLKDLQREHRRITAIVDTFYALLGDRNWVFTGDACRDCRRTPAP